jgi:hypothetical protein
MSYQDWNTVLEKGSPLIQAERKQYPDKYPKQLVPDHGLYSDLPKLTQNLAGFTIYEVDDPKQLIAIKAFWTKQATEHGLETFKSWYIPIADHRTFVDLVKHMPT